MAPGTDMATDQRLDCASDSKAALVHLTLAKPSPVGHPKGGLNPLRPSDHCRIGGTQGGARAARRAASLT